MNVNLGVIRKHLELSIIEDGIHKLIKNGSYSQVVKYRFQILQAFLRSLIRVIEGTLTVISD